MAYSFSLNTRLHNTITGLLAVLLYSCLLTPAAYAQRIQTDFDVKLLARGLSHPWGMAFLPDGRILVTERVGRLRIVTPDGRISGPVSNVPAVYHKKQGGLLDVALDPDFAANRLVYLSYAEPVGTSDGTIASTAVARAELDGNSLKNLKVIFRQNPKTDGGQHFGSRLVFAPDGNLFITLGDRGNYKEEAQNIDNHIGAIIRIRPDGSVPEDNPFVKNNKAKPEIWSYGHRSVQGAAIHPKTGELWIHEHGPRGGDEINIPEPGKNYGWPNASYGTHYSMIPIKDEHAEQGYEEPIYYWTPSVAPSGMLFYTGGLFPGWRNNLFVGTLAGQHLIRLSVSSDKVLTEEQLLKNTLRFRDVEQGPDGAIYLLTDENDGKILKLLPTAE
ncbi:Glucose/arabinose dehydrogenase, beta-propeller fold [Nitrosomonas sp. Nm51]|uniref:PQQ-dependent sugar dehydrogenase n=1 Tax=Nitrosomonas sp. Nm51 TaxID=133720 RepID=UPI0008B23E21|nr:PQQ-dependent sugar dehydrogenase [Nitrosomonas sp. Nm51]SER21512.1 Glucose/arabinose dehydrogenase, beta-propeller fold [Nitrosomonas sp. Nm51]